ncbi:DUF2250 domain-containing protein [Desulfohalovibrio reitneri]|uniref:DUF2250 domain-containing protein n=1 Tax=Desulfohalovibrio reitneri TaxID=1307759 RepID=UPI0004A6BD7C|nr:DUF2250 domain-containing protein [Desulfohalovibrio reitneri]
MTGDQRRILYYLEKAGPAYAKKLAEVLRKDWRAVEEDLTALDGEGLIERVPGSTITYSAGKRGKVTKHMNHTYYRPTRHGRLTVRRMKTPPEVDLTPPWKRAGKG